MAAPKLISALDLDEVVGLLLAAALIGLNLFCGRSSSNDRAVECLVSYRIPNTPQSPSSIPQGKLIDDRHNANSRKSNTTHAIAELSLQSEGISD